MSVYTDLVRIGIEDESAHEMTEAVHRSRASVTIELFDARLAQLEARIDTRLAQLETRLLRAILTTMISLTAIYGFFVAGLAWVITR